MEPIPQSVTVNTGEQHLIQPTIDCFFQDTAEYIYTNYGLKRGPDPFQIKSGEIAYYLFFDVERAPISNDRVTYLSFYGRVIASVMEIRTEFNHVQYTFFRNLDGIEELVQRYDELCTQFVR